VPVRVLVADDDPLMRRLLRAFLDARPELSFVGEASDGRSAAALAVELRPDVVVLDGAMPGGDGFVAARAIRAALPDCRIVIFSGQDAAGSHAEARAAGADRFVEKHGGMDGLVEALLTPPAA
jgi:two-component system response regulator DesR